MPSTAADLVPADLDALLADPAADPRTQLARIRGFLAGIDPAAWVRDAARRVLADGGLAERVGQQAVEHPNGFDLINLAGPLPTPERRPAYRVRLHVWWPERRGAVEDVHNHAWDFASAVLCGTLRFLTYSPDPAGEPYYWYPYAFGSQGAFRAEEVRRVHLACGFDGELAAGTRYAFDHRQLHRVVPTGGGVVATLMVTGRFLRDGSDIYAEAPRHERGARLPRAPLGAAALRARLGRLLACGL